MVMEVWTYRDTTLRGLDVTGFDVEALDGVIGRVERTASEARGGYLVVDAGTLAPLGGRVLLPAGVVDTVDVDAERVFVRVTRDEIRSAPEYDWQVPLDQRRRDEFAAYYGAARPKRPSEPRRPARRPASTRREQRPSRAERTKAELYDEAKKLGIESRSKMSKAELARAIERHGGRAPTSEPSAKANPIEVQRFLEGVGYPTGKSQLVKEAKQQGASGEVRKTLERLPDKRFKTPTEVSEAIGKLR